MFILRFPYFRISQNGVLFPHLCSIVVHTDGQRLKDNLIDEITQ